MSELEKLQRDVYQKNRNREITKRSVIALVLIIALIFSGLTANRLSQSTFVTYTESGKADYQVYLSNNEFYSEEYLDSDHAYVAALIDEITATLSYDMNVNSSKTSYEYSYFVDARLEIQDKDSGAPLFDPTYELVAEKTMTGSGKTLSISEPVVIDYHKYNDLARKYVAEYNLSGTNSTLIVTLHVNVLSDCPDYANAEQGNYNVELRIPLNKTTLKITTSTTVPTSESKVLACNNRGAILFKILSIILAVAAAIWGVLLVLYIVRTRDRHIDYARRVGKILSSYKSYIQRINNPFDASGYQVLNVDTFPELLEIRDTLQMPILMYEDEDKTCSEFVIAACNGLLYRYEISVEVGSYEVV